MNSHQVFRELRRIFGAQSYTSIATLAGWDSAHVSKMRSGQQRISASFFLKLCFAKNWTPKKMMDECGIEPDYFWRTYG